MHSDDENKDPVWDLLGKAPPHQPGPFFARNVLREVRKLREEGHAPGGILRVVFARRAWLGGVAAAAVALVLAMVFLNQPAEEEVAGHAPVQAPVEVPLEAALSVAELDEEIEGLDYLDELLAVQDTTLLSDDDIAALLF